MSRMSAEDALEAALKTIDLRVTLADQMSTTRTAAACGAAGVVMLSMMTALRDKGLITDDDIMAAMKSVEGMIAGTNPEESIAAWAVSKVLDGMNGVPDDEPPSAEVIPFPPST